MTVQSVSTSSILPSLTKTTCRTATTTIESDLNVNSTPNSAPMVTISQAARQLAAQDTKYDFTNMTPNQMKGIAQELIKAGKIDAVQLFELENAGVPLGRMGANGELIPLSEGERASYLNKPVNYLQIAQNSIQYIKASGREADSKSTIKEWEGLLNLMQQGQLVEKDVSQLQSVANPIPKSA